jgi:type I restriction enzyme R subunit
VQLGLTATPKRKDNVDTYAYFGEPVYTYSLKEGINDGFLTPFRSSSSRPAWTITPTRPTTPWSMAKWFPASATPKATSTGPSRSGARGASGEAVHGADRPEAEDAGLLRHPGPRADGARPDQPDEDQPDPDYCHRVTANDGALGEQYLKTFQDNEKTIPTILTTSQKLSTGVDARNIRNIVLMRPVNSMIEFKQIIGRGTRLYDGKDYFTIYDFVKAHDHFSDPEWDGEPEDQTTEKPKGFGEEKEPWPTDGADDDGGDEGPKPRKLIVKLADGKERTLQHIVATTFWSPDGTPISAKQFLEGLYGALPDLFKDEDELRALWSDPATRRKLLDGLGERGFSKDMLGEMQRVIDAEKSDLFDVLAYIAFARPPLSREARAETARGEIQTAFDDKQQGFLDFVLSQYVKEGVDELDQEKLPPLLNLKYGALADAIADLGDPEKIRQAFVGFQKYLYRDPTQQAADQD